MTRCSALLALICIAGCAAQPRPDAGPVPKAAPAPAVRSAVVEERHELLMLAALAKTYAGLDDVVGYDISAVIAWDVDDASKTPDFVIERNRNFEKQGDIHHAEINTLRAAYDRRRDFDVPPSASRDERVALYAKDLANTTLFTTLEPCPMCATTITMAWVPRAIYCMEDPGLRDEKAPIVIPTKFYNRELAQERSRLPACERANRVMWHVHAQAPTRFRITKYLTSNGREVFGPGWKALSCATAHHPENAELLDELQRATGATACGKGPRRRVAAGGPSR
jgi:tRNA(Arg) A34 adenosine deaminase TadA